MTFAPYTALPRSASTQRTAAVDRVEPNGRAGREAIVEQAGPNCRARLARLCIRHPLIRPRVALGVHTPLAQVRHLAARRRTPRDKRALR